MVHQNCLHCPLWSHMNWIIRLNPANGETKQCSNLFIPLGYHLSYNYSWLSMFVWGFCCTALPPGQNRKHFADCRQFFQMHCFYINMFCFSLNFTEVCSCIPNWNKSALVYIMPWYQNINVKACLNAPPPQKKKKKYSTYGHAYNSWSINNPWN